MGDRANGWEGDRALRHPVCGYPAHSSTLPFRSVRFASRILAILLSVPPPGGQRLDDINLGHAGKLTYLRTDPAEVRARQGDQRAGGVDLHAGLRVEVGGDAAGHAPLRRL